MGRKPRKIPNSYRHCRRTKHLNFRCDYCDTVFGVRTTVLTVAVFCPVCKLKVSSNAS